MMTTSVASPSAAPATVKASAAIAPNGTNRGRFVPFGAIAALGFTVAGAALGLATLVVIIA